MGVCTKQDATIQNQDVVPIEGTRIVDAQGAALNCPEASEGVGCVYIHRAQTACGNGSRRSTQGRVKVETGTGIRQESRRARCGDWAVNR